ncbi:MAG TPA: hypothetical protein VK742_03935 [Candidatus Sulfotelmatobacter sp.]|nr:hypothetical protein [Candidatus Sulfotelmatobacter sp.]
MKANYILNESGSVRRTGSGGGFIKFILITVVTAALTLSSARPASGEPVHTNGLVWAGLDYSQVRLIGSGNFDYGFLNPSQYFPDMFQQWNELFISERLSDAGSDLEKFVLPDLGGVTARNAATGTNQIILHPGTGDGINDTHLPADAIAAEVQALNLEHTNGLGLVFIVDRFVYGMQKGSSTKVRNITRYCGGAVYVVFFDVATRRVISAKREVYPTSMGVSFRNFWFGPIKDTASTLDKYRDLKSSF